MIRRLAGSALLLLSLAGPVAAQDSVTVAPPVQQRCDTAAAVERVVAVVGEAPILASQVDESAFQKRSQGAAMTSGPDSLRTFCQGVLSDLIDIELMVQEAQRDTAIKVSEQEIADGVEQQMRSVRSKFQSELDYRAELKRAAASPLRSPVPPELVAAETNLA